MPLVTSGEGYRTWADPRVFDCDSQGEIADIEYPVDKAYAFVGEPDGLLDWELWKFDAASVAVASATVIVPDNPLFASEGRWIQIPTGASTAPTGLTSGHGSPEGVVTTPPNFYWDIDSSQLYANLSASGNTGWFSLLTL